MLHSAADTPPLPLPLPPPVLLLPGSKTTVIRGLVLAVASLLADAAGTAADPAAPAAQRVQLYAGAQPAAVGLLLSVVAATALLLLPLPLLPARQAGLNGSVAGSWVSA